MRLYCQAGLAVALLCSGFAAQAVDLAQLREEVLRVREELKAQDDPKINPVTDLDLSVYDKFGPDQAVTTNVGKLRIKGLLQVWYQHIQNDNRGIVDAEPNGRSDNDTMRIRRTELHFEMNLTENITGFVMMDPAREANVTFTPVPTFPNHNALVLNPHIFDGVGQQGNNNIIPQLLQDAYINFHDECIIPHHEFRVGQFKPPSGEEAWRKSEQLDFVERSMVTGINNVRDIGLMAHGAWFYPENEGLYSGRIQYWLGVFNGPDGTVLTDPEIVEGGNRSDDNSDKDFAWRVAVQPVWNKDKWYGRMELGYARTDGFRGRSNSGYPFNDALQVNGINRDRVAINRQSAWVWYRPGNVVKGWWMRGEFGSGRDHYGSRLPTTLFGIGSGLFGNQLDPKPVTAEGLYAATGYDLSQSIFAKCLNDGGRLCKALGHSELALRYEQYQNVAGENPTNPDRETNLFRTEAYTMGVNYYIDYKTFDNAKIQANYIIVDDPRKNDFGIRKIRNDMFVVNFQVMF